MLPEEAKSSYQMADSGYDTYLRDAHRQVNLLSPSYFMFCWPFMNLMVWLKNVHNCIPKVILERRISNVFTFYAVVVFGRVVKGAITELFYAVLFVL